MLFSREKKEGYISESQGPTKGSPYLYNFTPSLVLEGLDGGMKKVTGFHRNRYNLGAYAQPQVPAREK